MRPNTASRFFFVFLCLLLSACQNLTEPPSPTITAGAATARPKLFTPTPDVVLTPSLLPTSIAVKTQAADALQSAVEAGMIFVSETIPDGSVFNPGQSFKKSWTIKNNSNHTWSNDYVFIRTADNVGGAGIVGPELIKLPRDVKAGETITVEAELISPKQNGQYALTYRLQSGSGLMGGNDRIWVNIVVGSANPGATSSGRVSASLTHFETQADGVTVYFCMTFPDTLPNWMISSAEAVTLQLDDQKITASSGGGQGNCFDFKFIVPPDDLAQSTHVSVNIQSVFREGASMHDDCEAVKPGLLAAYPGLDFKCEGQHDYYSQLVVPAGITRAAAHTAIVDAINHTIYGPWVLVIS